jgi:hypothetical protein
LNYYEKCLFVQRTNASCNCVILTTVGRKDPVTVIDPESFSTVREEGFSHF